MAEVDFEDVFENVESDTENKKKGGEIDELEESESEFESGSEFAGGEGSSDEDEDDDDENEELEDEDELNIEKKGEFANLEYEDKDDSDDSNDSDEDSDEDENYLQKLDEHYHKKVIENFHPELKTINYEEVETLATVVRDKDNNIIDPLHRTIPILSRYERARILGERAKQINSGAKPFIDVEPSIMDGYLIALKELEQKRIPFIIQRPLPNGASEYWRITDLEVL